MSETAPSRWGTVREAAQVLGVHTMTIRRYIKAGDLPARRKGVKLIEVDLDAVRALMAPVEPTVTRVVRQYAGARSGQ
jgi:excisionase family DNA binding protein